MTERVLLTVEDFKKLNCENVGHALQNLSGVTVSTLGEVSLRDVSSSKVVIVFDGQRLNTAGSTGVRGWNPAGVELKEIESTVCVFGGPTPQSLAATP